MFSHIYLSSFLERRIERDESLSIHLSNHPTFPLSIQVEIASAEIKSIYYILSMFIYFASRSDVTSLVF